MFITFEGVEGVGKTTHLKFLAEELQKQGIDFIETREPGGTPLGEEIRDILLRPREEKILAITELLLLFAARAEHLEKVIHPALKQGRWVLCDRFVDASYAYQGGGRGINLQDIMMIEQLVLGEFRPDLTLILDAPIEIGFQRIQGRNILDRIESEDLAFFERVRQTYHAHAIQNPKRYKVIDATQSLQKVQEEITKILTNFLPRIINRN